MKLVKKANFSSPQWVWGVTYEEKRSGDGIIKYRWFCLACDQCRTDHVNVTAYPSANSNVTNHLRDRHSIVGVKSHKMAAARAVAGQQQEGASQDRELAAKNGEARRWDTLHFVKTYTIGEFAPFIHGEKPHVRAFINEHSEWYG